MHDTAGLLANNPNPVQPEAYARQALAYLQFDALDRLHGINAPLVIVGEQDLLTPPWVAREVADGIPKPDSSSHRRRHITFRAD